MKVEATFDVASTREIPESSGYLEAKADSIVTVGMKQRGSETMTLIFMDSYPVVGVDDSGSIIVTAMEKRRIASITIGQEQAENFYKSLKSIFEKNEQDTAE
ncbi:Uncharacterised protein [Yersinia kristensenii]|nr:Uncharacterised protein [Yersinia kristensenii]